MVDLPRVAIRPLASAHERRSFACGAEALDRCLQTQATEDVRKRVAACFVLTEDGRPRALAYYTLSAASILLDGLPTTLGRKLPGCPSLPATRLGRLATDRMFRGKRCGELMLLDALHRSLEATERIGAMAVLVVAKDANAATFYARYGFVVLPEHAQRMFLPTTQVAQLF